MAKSNETILCRSPRPDRRGVPIVKWKYDRIRAIILGAVPQGPDGIGLRELRDRVKSHFSEEERRAFGSIPWYTDWVRLDLEVNGVVERIPGERPARVRRGSGDPAAGRSSGPSEGSGLRKEQAPQRSFGDPGGT